MPVKDVVKLIDERVEAIRAFHNQSGIKRAELDVSGGVDSAVMLGLLTKALGPENVTAAFLGIGSNPEALKRAKEVANTYKTRLITLNLDGVYKILMGEMEDGLIDAGYLPEEIEARTKSDPTIHGSIRSTLRAPIGRALNRLTGGGIRHGTGNEDEDRFMRFYQKGGDGEVDTNPIAMLSKGEVFQLALGLDVPLSIITARPSPDLWANGEEHNDEDEISNALGLRDCLQTMYSYIDPGTGKYTHTGLIERLARWSDITKDALFSDFMSESEVKNLPRMAKDHKLFHRINLGIIERLFESVRRIEKGTRHKQNPNIPTLGNRAIMVDAGILTNALEA